MTNELIYVHLMNSANNAARQAIAWARDPNGVKMARLRRGDARALRKAASRVLREPAR